MAMTEIDETIERLRAAPPHHGFAVTSECLTREFGGDIRKVPTPNYPHIMIWDSVTGNLLISRLADGDNWEKVLERSTLYRATIDGETH